MRRYVSTLASAISLLLCAATAVLWVRSYRGSDELQWHQNQCLLVSVVGRMSFYRDTLWHESSRGQTLAYWHGELEPIRELTDTVDHLCTDTPEESWKVVPFAGFGVWDFRDAKRSQSIISVSIPHWPLVLCLAPLPLLWLNSTFRLRRQRLRQHRRLCLSCGYDLRANPDRCPECGRRVVTMAAK